MSSVDFASSESIGSKSASKHASNSTIHAYKRRNSELERTIQDLRLRLANREEQITQAMVSGRIDAGRIKKILEATHDAEDKEAELRKLTDELDEARQTIESLKETEEQLRAEISSLKAKSPSQFQSGSSLSKQMTRLKAENSKLLNACATKEAQNAELIVENLSLRSQINDYENDSSLSSFHKSRLRSHNKALVDTLTKARGAIATLTDEARQTDSMIEQQKLTQESLAHSAQIRASGLQDEMQQLFDAFNSGASNMEHQIANIADALEMKFGDIKAMSHNAVSEIASLCAKLANMSSKNVPPPEELCSDPETLKFFIGRVETAFEMQEAAKRAELRKLEMTARSATTSKKEISPEVAQAVKTIQGRVAELTKTLHRDHKQLIDILTMESEAMAE